MLYTPDPGWLPPRSISRDTPIPHLGPCVYSILYPDPLVCFPFVFLQELILIVVPSHDADHSVDHFYFSWVSVIDQLIYSIICFHKYYYLVTLLLSDLLRDLSVIPPRGEPWIKTLPCISDPFD